MPGSWSILLGGLLRTGEDLSLADPVQAIARIGDRPVLIVAAGQDNAVRAGDAAEIVRAGQEEGASVELETCPTAGHGESVNCLLSRVLGLDPRLPRTLAAADP